MSVFEYTALDQIGKTRKGVIESDSIRQVRQILREKQWAPLTVEETAAGKTGVVENRIKISSQELALVTRQLATLIASALPIEESLKAAAEQNSGKKVVHLLLDVRTRIMEGRSFASALKEYPGVFPTLYVATIAAGEKSGHLDLILEKLADYVESRHEARQKIKLALLYPVILLSLSLLIVAGLLTYVVPKVVMVFANTGQELPVLTKGLLALSGFAVRNGGYFILLIFVLLLVVRMLLGKSTVRVQFDKLKLHTPVFGRLWGGQETARFVSTLSILCSSGIVLVDAMKIANEVVENLYIKKQLKVAAQGVEEGGSLRNCLSKSLCFPPIMVHMIGSGEVSGALDSMLQRAAGQQQKEMENQVALLVKLFEPFMLLVMGLVVLLIVLAILLPILNMNQLVL